VDDVSAGFSNLNIQVIKENSQLVSQEELVVDVLPEPLAHRQHFPFLFLPWLAKLCVYTHLPSRDCIALSRTCRQMYKFNTFAYTHLQFLPPNNLFSLSRSICQLVNVLAVSPHYAEAMRTIRIVGYNPADVSDGWDYELVYTALDWAIIGLLGHGRHVYSLTLDLDLTGVIHYFPKTFTKLLDMRTIRDLRLTTFKAPSYKPETIPPQEIVPDEEPPAYERVFLSVCSGNWLPSFVRDPRKLRWFGLSMLDQGWQPGDTAWAMTLHRVAEAATELETLVFAGGKHFPADVLGQMLQSGFVRGSVAVPLSQKANKKCYDDQQDRGVLRKLHSFSINMETLSLSSLRQLFSSFSRSSVTHLRIVVNHNGRWLCEFGPQYISVLAKFVPDLEEISLDQVGMPMPAPLPGHLVSNSAEMDGIRMGLQTHFFFRRRGAKLSECLRNFAVLLSPACLSLIYFVPSQLLMTMSVKRRK
jgi:hypothetical protein